MENLKVEHYLKPKTYAVWSKDKDNRFRSTSGGAFSEFARAILEKGGVVVGARYTKECLVEHCMIDNVENLGEIRQSKYMSSSQGEIYRKVKAELENGRYIGYCGSPCQVAGLYGYLGKDYNNLITMDFICRGMNSPKAFKSWLTEVEKEEKSKAVRVWFKYKVGGWKTSPKRTRIDFEDGHYVVKDGEDNLFMHGYLSSNLYIRPSCGNCPVKGVPRPGDITFADFWGIEKELDDDKGTSMLLINSLKGERTFDDVKENVNYYERDFEEIFAGNPMFTTSVIVPAKSYDFLVDLDNMEFTDALKKYGAFPKKYKVRNKIKTFIRKIYKISL